MWRGFELFAAFIWAEMLYVLIVIGGLTGLMSGELLGDLGVHELFFPFVTFSHRSACEANGSFLICTRAALGDLFISPPFLMSVAHTIMLGTVFIFWFAMFRSKSMIYAEPANDKRAVPPAGGTPGIGRSARNIVGPLSIFSVAAAIPALTLWAVALAGRNSVLVRSAGRTTVIIEASEATLGTVIGTLLIAAWLLIYFWERERGVVATRSITMFGLPVAVTSVVVSLILCSDGGFDAIMTGVALLTIIYILLRYVVDARIVVTLICGLVLLPAFEEPPGNPAEVRPYRVQALDGALAPSDAASESEHSCSAWARLVSLWHGFNPKELTYHGMRDAHADLLKPTEVLDAFYRNVKESPRVVLLTTSGGGYRATFWTTTVLDKLIAESEAGKPLENIAQSIVLLTGASGGAVAATYYAGVFDRGSLGEGGASTLTNQLAHDLSATEFSSGEAGLIDSLTPVARHFIRNDLLDIFLPRACGKDRGHILEEQWKSLNRVTFSQLADRQRVGLAPSLILSPTIVETGEPLYVTNLDLNDNTGRLISLFQYLPGAQSKMTLATAARLSATFPIITPTVRAPLPRAWNASSKQHVAAADALEQILVDGHIVDAGYYDNEGVESSSTFLLQPSVIEWIAQRGARVFVIQVEANPNVPEGADARGHWLSLVTRPLDAYLSGNESRSRLAAERTWYILGCYLAQRTGSPGSFQRFVFVNEQLSDVPMSWRSDARSRRLLRKALGSEHNTGELAKLAKAWQGSSSLNVTSCSEAPNDQQKVSH